MHATESSSPVVSSQRLGAITVITLSRPDVRNAVDADTAAFDAFLAALTRLQGERLLRVKGLVRFEGEAQPLVVQGVGHVFERPVPLPRLLAAAPPATGLTFITLGVSAAAITALWQATLALSR